jgi:hypothetical protein
VSVAWTQGGDFADAADSDWVQGDRYVASSSGGRPFRVQSLSADRSPDVTPRIAYGRGGAAIVVWLEARGERSSTSDTVRAAYAADGERYGPARTIDEPEIPQPVNGSLPTVQVPSVSFDSAGTAVVAWMRFPAFGRQEVAVSERRPSGAYSAPRVLSRRSGIGARLVVHGGGRATTAVTWGLQSPAHVDAAVRLGG